MDYLESGKIIKSKWLTDDLGEFADGYPDQRKLDTPELRLFLAAQNYVEGRPNWLLTLLGSEQGVAPELCQPVAEHIAKDLSRRRRGRPINNAHRHVARLVDRFLKDWKQYNEEHGVFDHGKTDNMIGFVIKFIWKEYYGWGSEVPAEVIRDIQRRPIARRL